jgi:hypothetical protein
MPRKGRIDAPGREKIAIDLDLKLIKNQKRIKSAPLIALTEKRIRH